MQYTYDDSIHLVVEPNEFNKNSGKEVLQYAVGGLLYMPASNKKIVNKIITGEYSFIKSMVLDLEDSLGDDMVKFGQRSIRMIVRGLAKVIECDAMSINKLPLIFIRVRSAKQIEETYSLLGDDIQYITGFNIPKFDKTTCTEFIESFNNVRETVLSNYGTDLYMMPIIESKHAMYRQLRMDNLLHINDSLKPIANAVLNIRVGGADFCNIFGIRRDVDSTIYEIGAVGDCLNDILNVFGKSYVVSAPVWEYFGTDKDGDWARGLKRELRADKLNGFIGKTSIHPTQLPLIQESLIVSHEDYLDAMSILGMNTNTVGVKKSVAGHRMNEVKTHSKWAQKIIGLSNVYGVRE